MRGQLDLLKFQIDRLVDPINELGDTRVDVVKKHVLLVDLKR